MPRPNLSALFAEFQLQHPDAPGLRLLEEIVDRLEALEQRPPPLRLVKVVQQNGQPGYVDPSIVTGIWSYDATSTLLETGATCRVLHGTPEEVRAQIGPEPTTTEAEEPRF